MKFSTKEIYTKAYSIPRIKFEDQQLTSFAGLVVFQKFFRDIDLWGRLKRCFEHLPKVDSYKPTTIIFCLILHVLLGFRRFRDVVFYSDDPMVKRLLGLNCIPSFSTLSRGLGRMDQASLNRRKVIVTNKKDAPNNVVSFHEGRGQQENVFGELKSQGQLDYIPASAGSRTAFFCYAMSSLTTWAGACRCTPRSRLAPPLRNAAPGGFLKAWPLCDAISSSVQAG